MTKYKHTQIGYLTIVILIVVIVFFGWLQITARAESPSVDSGANFAITFIIVLIVLILSQFVTLTTSIDEASLRVRFGLGIIRKTFSLQDIASLSVVKNHWYYGWGIRFWLWPKMWIYNISGFDAVEIRLKNGRIYRIGTDVPNELSAALGQVIE